MRIEKHCKGYDKLQIHSQKLYWLSGSPGSPGTPAKDAVIETVHPHEGNTYWVGEDGHLISLIHNSSAVNPTYSQLLSFIKNDKTDQRKYIPGKYTCGDFAETVQNNAEKAGYKAGWVTIEGINHCCNTFQTTDKGMIYRLHRFFRWRRILGFQCKISKWN